MIKRNLFYIKFHLTMKKERKGKESITIVYKHHFDQFFVLK